MAASHGDEVGDHNLHIGSIGTLTARPGRNFGNRMVVIGEELANFDVGMMSRNAHRPAPHPRRWVIEPIAKIGGVERTDSLQRAKRGSSNTVVGRR